jgi:hypothetical protein
MSDAPSNPIPARAEFAYEVRGGSELAKADGGDKEISRRAASFVRDNY